MKAIWKGTVIAESNDTVVVECNHYFPREGVSKEYLWHEYQQALVGKTTDPCDPTECKICGVC